MFGFMWQNPDFCSLEVGNERRTGDNTLCFSSASWCSFTSWAQHVVWIECWIKRSSSHFLYAPTPLHQSDTQHFSLHFLSWVGFYFKNNSLSQCRRFWGKLINPNEIVTISKISQIHIELLVHVSRGFCGVGVSNCAQKAFYIINLKRQDETINQRCKQLTSALDYSEMLFLEMTILIFNLLISWVCRNLTLTRLDPPLLSWFTPKVEGSSFLSHQINMRTPDNFLVSVYSWKQIRQKNRIFRPLCFSTV